MYFLLKYSYIFITWKHSSRNLVFFEDQCFCFKMYFVFKNTVTFFHIQTWKSSFLVWQSLQLLINFLVLKQSQILKAVLYLPHTKQDLIKTNWRPKHIILLSIQLVIWKFNYFLPSANLLQVTVYTIICKL